MTEHLRLAVAVLALTACHAMFPLLDRWMKGHSTTVASFGAGGAAAYVFLHLLPEVNSSVEDFGRIMYSTMLLGFVIFYGFETWIERRRPKLDGEHPFGLRISIAVIYNASIVFTIAEDLPGDNLRAVLHLVGISLHLIGMNRGLTESFGGRFHTHGRWWLAASVVASALLSTFVQFHEHVSDLITGLLAGFMLFTIFREELPSASHLRFGIFALGIGVATALYYLAG